MARKLKPPERSQCYEIGARDFFAGVPREDADVIWFPRSIAYREWLRGWDDAARMPLILFVEVRNGRERN